MLLGFGVRAQAKKSSRAALEKIPRSGKKNEDGLSPSFAGYGCIPGP